MQKELDLTPAQREHIELYLRESQDQTKQLWDSIAPRASDVHRKLRERIRAELTEDQQKRYEEVFKSRGTNRPSGPMSREPWNTKSGERRGQRTNSERGVALPPGPQKEQPNK